MLKKILSTFQKGTSQASPAPTLDIRRVIRAPQPEPEPEVDDSAEAEEEAPPAPEMEAPAADPALAAQEAVDSLAARFEIWMRMDLDTLADAWKAAQGADAGPDKYRAVFTAAHNIKGAANSYGYPSIARLAASLSDLLGATAPGENAALINIHIEACRAAFNSVGEGKAAKEIADAVCEALEQRVALKIAAG
ncbi:MAG: Hpt domain-containing protein [Hyphomonas sp.]|nr:Hpt domain-containing protein [Hyphomonas sp.]